MIIFTHYVTYAPLYYKVFMITFYIPSCSTFKFLNNGTQRSDEEKDAKRV